MYAVTLIVSQTEGSLAGLVVFGAVGIVAIGLLIWLTLTDPEKTTKKRLKEASKEDV